MKLPPSGRGRQRRGVHATGKWTSGGKWLERAPKIDFVESLSRLFRPYPLQSVFHRLASEEARHVAVRHREEVIVRLWGLSEWQAMVTSLETRWALVRHKATKLSDDKAFDALAGFRNQLSDVYQYFTTTRDTMSTDAVVMGPIRRGRPMRPESRKRSWLRTLICSMAWALERSTSEACQIHIPGLTIGFA